MALNTSHGCCNSHPTSHTIPRTIITIKQCKASVYDIIKQLAKHTSINKSWLTVCHIPVMHAAAVLFY